MRPSASAPPAVVVDRVSKGFRIPQERVHTLKERALHPFKRRRFDRLEVLANVSFEVRQGEFFGIVGRNGSGKSTLLKCLAGIYAVDSGDIYVNGRIATFIELGVGFNPDLAARDNILLNAIMLGLAPNEARARVEKVIDFAELHEFTDLKLKNYSSGMHVRLAFSVMIQVDAEVLLIDEVLAVGDAAFQQKCFDEFHRLRDERKTILFVTHDMSAVRRFCQRALVLERGELLAIGDPEQVSDEYIRLNFPDQAAPSVSAGAEPSHADAAIADAWFEGEEGIRHEYLPQRRPCAFRALIDFRRQTEDPSFTLMIRDEESHNVFGASTAWAEQRTGRFGPGDRAMFGVTFDNLLSPGRRYYATVIVATRGGGQQLLDRRERAATFVSTGSRSSDAIVELPHEVEVRRQTHAEVLQGAPEETRA
jgi:ABC-type polysaccharide/polyol phosphate transport system ATPase subunit